MEGVELRPDVRPPSGSVPWPFDRIRDGQSDFLQDARRTLADGKHLLAHAPTGIGKTAVALVAALDYALTTDKLVLFLTSRQSHHRIAIETVRRIEAKGPRIPTIDLIAKHSMCLQEGAPSHGRAFQEFCDFKVKSRTCGFFTRDNSAVVAAVLQRTLHVQELVRASGACGVCPHRVAMDAAAKSRLVVCDYNYVFSEIRERFLPRLGRSLEDLILIVDEAHNLPDRIRAHLVGDLAVMDLLKAAKEARSIDGEVAHELVGVAKSMERFLTALRSERMPPRMNSWTSSRRASAGRGAKPAATRRSSRAWPSRGRTRSGAVSRRTFPRSRNSSCDGGIRTRASCSSSFPGRTGSSPSGCWTRVSSAGPFSTWSTRASRCPRPSSL